MRPLFNPLKVKITKLCLTLCDPMDCTPPAFCCPRDFPGKNTGVGCHFLLQGIFPTQGSSPGLLHYRQILYHLSHQRSPLAQFSSVAQSCPTLCDPINCKEIQPVHSKGDQPWAFFGRNDAKAETPVLWPPHAKS